MFAIPVRRIAAVWPLLWLGLQLAGCSSSPPLDPSGNVEVDTMEVDAADRVTLEVIDKAALADVLAQHRGKVVLVDFWATWCEPCKKLFPHTVELHEQFAGQGLAVLSVSLDDPEDEDAITEFLTERHATFPNFVSRYGAGPQSMEAFGIDNGAVPHFKLYDRDGKLHRAFASGTAPLDPRQIDRSVEELLDL